MEEFFKWVKRRKLIKTICWKWGDKWMKILVQSPTKEKILRASNLGT
jgi:hypothetical protein